MTCFLKDVAEGLFLIWRGEGVPKNWSIVTERIRKVLDLFINFKVQSGGMKELETGGASPCISGRV